MKAPCQNCADRHSGCHAECARYAEYRAICNDLQAARNKTADAHRVMREYARTTSRRLERHWEGKNQK